MTKCTAASRSVDATRFTSVSSKFTSSQVLFSKRINRKYEEINEKTVETEYEFLTEQEMEDKGWSE